ncbi:hypothetical protein BKA60DRAFT_428105, partial [Fusarium oxysporum]
WDRAYRMNAKPYIWLLRAAEEHLEDMEGYFISTSSVTGISGMNSSLVTSL